MLREKWRALKARCQSCSRLTLGVGVALVTLLGAGLVFGGGAAALAWTNTEKFCISCHTMRDHPYAEYQDTIHASNRTGVRATCPDCHVPRQFGPKIVAKIGATSDLY